MSILKSTKLEQIGAGMIAPTPTINITDPILFNTCLAATADNDEVRDYLRGLSIDPAKKTITGCNGFFFVRGEALNFSNWKSKEKILIFPAKKLPNEVSFATINIKEKSITGLCKKGHFSIPFSITNKKYPGHEHFIATDENKIAAANICLNPHFLRKLQKASFSIFTNITTHKPENNPIFYSIELSGSKIHSEYTAIVMPGHA